MKCKMKNTSNRFVWSNRRRHWKNVVRVLACAVVFVTTYALILPAISIEKDTEDYNETIQQTAQMLSTEQEVQPTLICASETLDVHTHIAACYNADGAIVCGLADYAIHTHDSLCYDAQGLLTCTLREVAEHIHTSDCYSVGQTVTIDEGHAHTQECYTTEMELTCTEEEGETHSHTDACYQELSQLFCTQEERSAETQTTASELTCTLATVEPHEHTATCYTEDVLTCGKLQTSAHQHTDDCFVQVLEENTDAFMSFAALSASDAQLTLYFAVPKAWEINNSTFKVNVQYDSTGNWQEIVMTDTGDTHSGLRVLKAVFQNCNGTKITTLQFQRHEGSSWKVQIDNNTLISGASTYAAYNNMLFDSASSTWTKYINLDDHTSFAGERMMFKNVSGQSIPTVSAKFYEKDANNAMQQVGSTLSMSASGGNLFYVDIPSEACSYVQFVDENGNVLGHQYSAFYGQTETDSNITSFTYDSTTTFCYIYTGSTNTWGANNVSTVYYDATLSKLSYASSNTVDGGQGIPYAGTYKVYCYMTGTAGNKSVEMTRIGSTDIYSVAIPNGYTRIRFAGSSVSDENSWNNSAATGMSDIPTNLAQPCFFGDTSDQAIYTGGNRSGYWGELGSVRDAEAGKNTDTVDIATGTFNKASDTLYLPSTFYDYYTDYELNGQNRDSYTTGYTSSYRTWYPFRQFDQALSDYYQNASASIPIYTGHFQPNWNDGSDWGITFSTISNTLGLYGYNGVSSQSGFMSTNNSTMNASGSGTRYDCAAQGLVNNTLANGQLNIKNGSVALPHFNESFLLGNNSKNTKLGEVYNNVSFPFTKVALNTDGNKDSNGVDYWYFDSAETTLEMKQDSSTQEYYLANVGNQDKYKNLDSASNYNSTSATYGFFPFNAGASAGNANTYNYGFGTKIEFQFRLTEDGTVVANNGTNVPIRFHFSGDDDVWVFVDGKLALDIGGAHGKVTGYLDFKTKTSYVSKVKTSQGSSTEGTNVTSSFTMEGNNTDVHTLTFYFMERGMWESNMKIAFNFPDENLFEVEKQVDTTDVNPLFDGLFTNADIFGFTIKNAATHHGTVTVSGDSTTAVSFNTGFAQSTLTAASSSNTFVYSTGIGGRSNVVHWKALLSDSGDGTYKDKRWGSIKPDSGSYVNASAQAYLSFDVYDASGTPSLSDMFVELVDSSGNKATARLSAANTTGVSSLKQNTWHTIRVNMSALKEANSALNTSQIATVKFAYYHSHDIYLDEVKFSPAVTSDVMKGFVVQQNQIPDYGSVAANGANGGKPTLMPANGAKFSVSGATTARYGKVDENGVFNLSDGETARFSNQFRRGSYIYLEETGVDPEVYNTTWTLTENGQQITRFTAGSTVQNPSPVPSLTGRSGAIEDGRIEVKDSYSSAANYTQQSDTTENSIVFRSYTNPDSTVATTKLKATFVNKVKTGSITIAKTKDASSPDLSGTYTFRVTFTNVAGSALEGAAPIVQEFTLQSGESKTISGIPINTQYTIEEISASDGARLTGITLGSNTNNAVVDGDKVVGTVKGDGTAAFTFANSTRPLMDIPVEKLWKNAAGDSIDDQIESSVYLQLQRKTASTEYTAVTIAGKNYVEVEKGYGGWTYTFTGLEQYADTDKTAPYTYRIVEGTLVNGAFTPVENGQTIVVDGKTYSVTSPNGLTGEANGDTYQQLPTQTITNTLQENWTLTLQKVDANVATKRLQGAWFALYSSDSEEQANIPNPLPTGLKATPDATKTKDGTTYYYMGVQQSGENGEITWQDLKQSSYLYVEVQAPEDYLLDGTLRIVERPTGTPVKTETVTNVKTYVMPETGGQGTALYLLGGIAIMAMALGYSIHQRRREGGKAFSLR